MNKRLIDALAPGLRVWVPAMSNASALLESELRADPERAAGVCFAGVQFPGTDPLDYLALHPEARQLAWFMTPSVRQGLREGRADLRPSDYRGIADELLRGPEFDVVIAQLTVPDANGWCDIGLNCDFLPLVWPRAKRRVAHLNPSLPRLPASFRVHISEIDAIVEADCALQNYSDPGAGAVEQTIGSHIAALVQDGSTLQFGMGGIPQSLGQALGTHRQLRFHGGMMTSAVKTLWELGALDPDETLTAGLLLGDSALRDFARAMPHFLLTDATRTHDPMRIGGIPKFIAVNGAVEVDLFGQVNAERANGAIQAGAGGLPAFAHGALVSPEGRLVTCLPATARGGSVSRIVPCLADKALVTLPRYMADTVVTEFGVAEIRHLGIESRARALIDIAAPAHQAALGETWDRIRSEI